MYVLYINTVYVYVYIDIDIDTSFKGFLVGDHTLLCLLLWMSSFIDGSVNGVEESGREGWAMVVTF